MSLEVHIEKRLQSYPLTVEFAAGAKPLAILGPSGAGKTMTLRCIAGLVEPDRGRIILNDRVLFDSDNKINVPSRERRIGLLFQNYALFSHMTVSENIAFGVDRIAPDERARKVRGQLDALHLAGLESRLPRELSGGEQQCVALARALAIGPDALLLDEPLSALDEQLRVQMRLELQRMQRELGITFVHVTHSQLEAIALADMVVVMEAGQIKQAGPAREVYASPRDRYVAEFLGGQNVLSGKVETIEGGRLMFAQPDRKALAAPLRGNARIGVGDRIDVAVRRDDIELLRPDAEISPQDRSALSSRVLAIEYQGSFVKVMLDAIADEEFVAYVPERVFFKDPLSIGDVVLATWAIDHARLLERA